MAKTSTTVRARVGLLFSAALSCAALIAVFGCSEPSSPAGGVLLPPPASSAADAGVPERPAEAGAPQDTEARGPSVISDPSAIPVQPAVPSHAPEGTAPTRLVVADAAIDVRVVDVGVTAGNEMEVPDSVDQAGWYRHGPAPGDRTGSAVIAAHVDTLSGLAPFSGLRQLQPGDPITVERAGAGPVAYRVADVRLMDKDEFDGADVFRRDGRPLLKLITCGGEWLDGRRDYSHNVVVTAVPD